MAGVRIPGNILTSGGVPNVSTPSFNTPSGYDTLVYPPSPSSGNAVAQPSDPSTRGGSSIGTGSIAQDIEGKADFYSPATYQFLLTYYHSCELGTDSNTDFIPISQTTLNSKMFGIGILAPQALVTGRPLDRSASVASVTGWPATDLDFGSTTGGAGSAATTGVSKNGVQITDPRSVPGNASLPHGADLPQSFWVQFVQMCQRLKVDPTQMAAVFESESGFTPSAQYISKDNVVIAQGLNQFTQSTANAQGISNDVWKQYGTLPAEQQLAWSEKFMASQNVAGNTKEQIYGKNFGGHPNPDGSRYATLAYINNYQPESDRAKFKDPVTQDAECKANAILIDSDGKIPGNALDKYVANRPAQSVIDSINKAKAVVGDGPPPPAPNPSTMNVSSPNAGTGPTWATSGSANAKDAKKAADKVVDTNLNLSSVGQKFQAAQANEAKITQMLLERMRNTPPLRLLVNPSSFKRSSEKIVNDGSWTRNGPIIEHWGDQQDKIDASGKLAGFFAIDANSPNPDSDGSSPGLTRVARNYTKSYQNFLSLYLIYKSNGYLLTTGMDQSNNNGNSLSRMSLVGSVYIYYDSTLYIGSFDNFNITETDDKPYTLEYNFQFTVRATFMLDHPDEFSLGAPPTQNSAPLRSTSVTSVPDEGKVTLNTLTGVV